MADTRGRGAPHAFSDEDRRRARAVSNPDTIAIFRVSEEDIDLLNEYYHLLRKRVKEDVLEIQNRAKHGEPTDAEIERWVNDRERLAKLGVELAAKSEAVKRLALLIYGSVPGYSLREYNVLPQMYYVFNEDTGALDYLGPASDAALAEMADLAIMADSPLYVTWVEVNRDHYKRWLAKHHDLYKQFTLQAPKLAAAVHGDSSAKASSSSHHSNVSSSHSSTSSTSHTSSGSWGAPPSRIPRTTPTPTPRPATPTIAPRIGIGPAVK
jgi:hypothetical protein